MSKELTPEQLAEALAATNAELSHAKLNLEEAAKVEKQLRDSLAEKETAVSYANSQLDEAKALITQLTDELSQLDDQSEVANDQLIITHAGKKYRALPLFKYAGTDYKAEDLKGNKDLVKFLVDKKSSILTPVVSEK